MHLRIPWDPWSTLREPLLQRMWTAVGNDISCTEVSGLQTAASKLTHLAFHLPAPSHGIHSFHLGGRTLRHCALTPYFMSIARIRITDE